MIRRRPPKLRSEGSTPSQPAGVDKTTPFKMTVMNQSPLSASFFYISTDGSSTTSWSFRDEEVCRYICMTCREASRAINVNGDCEGCERLNFYSGPLAISFGIPESGIKVEEVCKRCWGRKMVTAPCPDQAKYGPFMSCSVLHMKSCEECSE